MKAASRTIIFALALASALAACDSRTLGPGDSDPPDNEPGDTTPGGNEPGDTTPGGTDPDTADGSGDPNIPDPIRLPVVGHGQVSERYTAEIAARGDWAYTSTWSIRRAGIPGNAVKVWDVSGGTPQLVDSLTIDETKTTGDVQISDDGALLVVATERSNGSIVIYDRADPARPRQLSRFTSENARETGVHTVKLGRVGGRHYAFLSINPSPSRLVIVDITDPENPSEVFSRRMGNPFIHDVFVRDGLVFTALWNDGMTIWDIGGGGEGGSPENPVELGNVRTVGGSVHNFWWFHDPTNGSKRYVFVGEEGPGSVTGATSSGDIHVVDVSDLRNPQEVAFLTVPGAGAHNFVMDEAAGILYAAYYNGGVRVVDARGELGDCEAAERADDGRCDLRLMGREIGTALADRSPSAVVWGVAKVGRWLYASDMLAGIYKIDTAPLDR